MVESAVARPYSGYHLRIENKAAALVESVAQNHGFLDGNKRTSVILLHTLLNKSGYELVAVRGEGRLEHAGGSACLVMPG